MPVSERRVKVLTLRLWLLLLGLLLDGDGTGRSRRLRHAMHVLGTHSKFILAVPLQTPGDVRGRVAPVPTHAQTFIREHVAIPNKLQLGVLEKFFVKQCLSIFVGYWNRFLGVQEGMKTTSEQLCALFANCDYIAEGIRLTWRRVGPKHWTKKMLKRVIRQYIHRYYLITQYFQVIKTTEFIFDIVDCCC